jgi:hypothetical protein
VLPVPFDLPAVKDEISGLRLEEEIWLEDAIQALVLHTQ